MNTSSVAGSLVIRCTGIGVLFLPVLARAGEPVASAASGSKSWDIAVLILGLLFVKLGLVATLTLYALLRPRALRVDSDRLRATPGKLFVVGLLASVVLAILGGIIQALPDPLKGLGGVVLLLTVGYWLVSGTAAVALELGERLQSNLNGLGAGSDAAAVIVGGTLLALVGFLVGIGQVVEITVGLLGLGTAVAGLNRRRRSAAAAPLTPLAPTSPSTSAAEAPETNTDAQG